MGPTASGKSALGIHLAQQLDGVIINADTMQCYADLRIITARPCEEEEAQVPHRLYGIWDALTHGNAAMWQKEAVQAIKDTHAMGRLPILLGGTGMYIKALIDGIAPVPEIDASLHEAAKAKWKADPAAMVEELKRRDPIMAQRLEPNDQQRIIRAWEVLEQTGVSLAEWQEKPVKPIYDPTQFVVCYVDVPRETLYERINQRFDVMVAMGVLDEMRELMQIIRAAYPDLERPELEIPTLKGVEQNRDKQKYHTLPLLRAHGVPEMMAHLNDEMTLEAAIDKAKQNTRNYAKRQLTWIRNQLHDAWPIPYDLLKDKEKTATLMAELAKTVDHPALSH